MGRGDIKNFKHLKKIATNNGYAIVSQNGSHVKFKNDANRSFVAPIHLNKLIEHRLIKENNLYT